MAELRVRPPLLLFPQLAWSFRFFKKRHFNRNQLPIYLLVISSSLGLETAGPSGLTEFLAQLGKTNPIEFFGDRSYPAHSIQRHLPLSDRLIGTGRMYRWSTRSGNQCFADRGHAVSRYTQVT